LAPVWLEHGHRRWRGRKSAHLVADFKQPIVSRGHRRNRGCVVWDLARGGPVQYLWPSILLLFSLAFNILSSPNKTPMVIICCPFSIVLTFANKGTTKFYRIHRLLYISTVILFFIVHYLVFLINNMQNFNNARGKVLQYSLLEDSEIFLQEPWSTCVSCEYTPAEFFPWFLIPFGVLTIPFVFHHLKEHGMVLSFFLQSWGTNIHLISLRGSKCMSLSTWLSTFNSCLSSSFKLMVEAVPVTTHGSYSFWSHGKVNNHLLFLVFSS